LTDKQFAAAQHEKKVPFHLTEKNVARSGRDVPSSNYDMHSAICVRQNWKCSGCSSVLPAQEKQAHLDKHLDVEAAFAAAECGDLANLKSFLDHGGSSMSMNALGDTLLHAAVRGGNASNVRMLLERDADPTVKNSMLDIPLQIAMKKNDTEISLLLMKEAKVKGGNRAQQQQRRTLGDITNSSSSNNNNNNNSSSGGAADGKNISVSKNGGCVEMCGNTELCGNCGVQVPKANAAMHEAMCLKRTFRCPFCSTCIDASLKEEHLNVDDGKLFEAVESGDVDALKRMAVHGADLPGVREVRLQL
jgi:ankyrin repeat protein